MPEKITQPDLFLENNPELAEKHDRTQFNVSILGGDQSAEEANKLGYDLI